MEALVTYNPKPIKQGADWALTFKVKDANGQPISLSGYTGTCQLRERPGSPVLASPTVTITPATGTVVLSLAASVTLTLPAVSLVGDCFITTGTVTPCLWQGKIRVSPRVTQ